MIDIIGIDQCWESNKMQLKISLFENSVAQQNNYNDTRMDSTINQMDSTRAKMMMTSKEANDIDTMDDRKKQSDAIKDRQWIKRNDDAAPNNANG